MKKSAGVTLIELVVATAVIGLLTILVMSFLVDKITTNAIDSARSDLQLQTQLTLDLLNRDIKLAANVDGQNRWADTNSPNSPTDNYSWASDADTLILASPAQDDNQNILYEDPQVYVSYKNDLIYFWDGASRTLYKRILAAPITGNKDETTCPNSQQGCPHDIKLAENVDSFSLNYYDGDDNSVTPSDARSVRVTLSVSRTVFGRDLNVSQSIRAVFRNE